MIIAGTGHRPSKLGGYDEKVFSHLWNIAHDFLCHNKNQITQVISGGALGWDIALAYASLYEKIPLIMAVPFESQDSKWQQKDRIRYREARNKASRVEIVCKGGYTVHKMQVRNEWMIDHADVVLALWDGSSGGTANCIRYAETKNKRIINLWDVFNAEKE